MNVDEYGTTIFGVNSTHFDLRRLAAIYAGGVLGALARVGLTEAAAPQGPGEWPWATFAVNMAGALLLGYFFGRLRDQPQESLAHPFLATGICGTLTTFSAIQLELFEMVEGGHLGLAAAYVGATLAAGYAFVRLGIALERLASYRSPGGDRSPEGQS